MLKYLLVTALPLIASENTGGKQARDNGQRRSFLAYIKPKPL
jgi:hypothetical protein